MYIYDFFIAHAGPDGSDAERLYDFLAASSKVFLDSKSLRLGDDWDLVIPMAQMQSKITVVLLSQSSPAAFYAREEVRAAISLARSDPDAHRVVPIFLAATTSIEDGSNYGLRLKHGLKLSASFTLRHAADKLLELVADLANDLKTSAQSKRKLEHPKSITRKLDLNACLRCVFSHLQTQRNTRLHTREAISIITSTIDLNEIEAAEALQLMIDKGLVRAASGQRIELTDMGLRSVTTGGY